MSQPRAFLAAVCFTLSCLFIQSTAAAGFVSVDDATWNEPAVRRVLQTFAYGGHATDQQIQTWAAMSPWNAIKEMLTFDTNNPLASPAQDATPSGELEQLRAFLGSSDLRNLICPSRASRFNMTKTQTSGRVVLARTGLQYAWMESVNKRGRNPFRDKVAFWLTNYHMAVTLESAKPTLVVDFYDDITLALENGAPFYEILALGAKSAAIAYQYGHRNNRMTNAGVFLGNDDFARELHQLFFRINGVYEDPAYHEGVTVENTARALTGMQLDQVPGLYGTTRTSDWWTGPIDFSDHMDAAGRQVRNTGRHHGGDLEISGTAISGATAAEKLDLLAGLAVFEQESRESLPLAIISYFADDNLTPAKIASIQDAWAKTVGQRDNLLQFLQEYAISTTFHATDSIKYRNSFDRNMLVYNLNTVDNEESYRNSTTPRTAMIEQGGELFVPAHAVFGGQTSREAADSPDLFKEAYNSAVNTPNRIGKRLEVCNDDTGARLWVWNKDWSSVMPAKGGVTLAGDAARWLWERFIGDGGRNFGPLERAHITALLAAGQDLASVIDPVNPDLVDLSVASLSDAALDARVTELETVELALNAPRLADRREANRRVGLAVNFISVTPYMFASGGDSTIVPPPPVEPPPVEPPPVEPPPVEPPPVEPPPVEPPPVEPPSVEPPPVEPPPVEPPPVERPPVEPPPVEPPPPTIAGAGKVELDGIIQKAGANWIVVNNQTVWVTSNTLVKFADKQAPREFALGLRTELKGWPNVDGSVTAIKIVVDNER